MGAEIYQAQVIRNFFDTITGPDRNLTRIYMCVISLAKLRMEPPEKLKDLMDQVRKSREKKELSVDILDYVCNVAIEARDLHGPDGLRGHGDRPGCPGLREDKPRLALIPAPFS